MYMYDQYNQAAHISIIAVLNFADMGTMLNFEAVKFHHVLNIVKKKKKKKTKQN